MPLSFTSCVASLLIMFAALTLVRPAHVAAQAKPVELVLGHPFPAGHIQHQQMLLPLAKELAEKSKGRIKLTIHPGGALGPGPGVYENVVAGAMDIGWTLQGYTPGRFPLTGVVEIPFLWEGAEQASKVLWQLYEKHAGLRKEYADVKVLALWTHDLGHIYTTRKPVRTLEDLKGLRLRFPGPMQRNLLAALGAVPVGMPAPDIYDAMERGIIDGTAIANSGTKSFRLYEVIKHAAQTGLYVASMGVFMNRQSWERLSPEDRKLIDSVTGEGLSVQGGKTYDGEDQAALKLLKDHRVEIYRVPPKEMERWRTAAKAVTEEWMADLERRGLDARGLYNLMLELAGKR
jgi:TRAP-type transport system periplasmic protein